MSAIYVVSLIIVAVLVQNASGKRGCASFGHACYGGHGKRSSSGPILPEGFDGSSQALLVESMPPPLPPYAKVLQMDRSRGGGGGYEADGGTFLRPGLIDLIAGRDGPAAAGPFAGSRASQQDRFEQTVRMAVNAVLRQMLEENRLQRDQQDESGQLQKQQQPPQHHPQMDSEQN